MEFSRQEDWSGLPFPTPGDLPDPGIKPTSPGSPALAGGFFAAAPPGKPVGCMCVFVNVYLYVLCMCYARSCCLCICECVCCIVLDVCVRVFVHAEAPGRGRILGCG